jgi:membrane-bound lytic murein transglycosylase D
MPNTGPGGMTSPRASHHRGLVARARRWLAAATLALLAVPAFATTDAALPRPAGLEPDIAFWRRIFAEVSTREALVHDNRYLGIVYEQLSFPADATDGQVERAMTAARERHAATLRRLASTPKSDWSRADRKFRKLLPADFGPDRLRAAADRVRVQLGLSDRFRAGLVRSGRWRAHIRDQLADAGVPAALAALPHVESSFNPEARSFVGAAGLWQFTAGTGRQYLRINDAIDERRDPFRSSEAAARLLRSNYAALGSWPLAITAYNHGVGGMRRAVRDVGSSDIEAIVRNYSGPAFGFASRNFYVSFLAAEEVERNAERYFGPVTLEPAEPYATVALPHYLPVGAVARALGVSLESLREYNPAVLPTVWAGRRDLPEGYGLRLPPGAAEADPAARLADIPAAERGRKPATVAGGRHRVKPGESLSVIARRYGTTSQALARANGLRNTNQVRAGQWLKVPGAGEPDAAPARAKAGAGTYVVRRGDNLAVIAKRTGVSQRRIMALNSLDNPNRIYPGQRLRLRG